MGSLCYKVLDTIIAKCNVLIHWIAQNSPFYNDLVPHYDMQLLIICSITVRHPTVIASNEMDIAAISMDDHHAMMKMTDWLQFKIKFDIPDYLRKELLQLCLLFFNRFLPKWYFNAFAKLPFRSIESHLYLTAIATAKWRWHLLNIVIFYTQTMFK